MRGWQNASPLRHSNPITPVVAGRRLNTDNPDSGLPANKPCRLALGGWSSEPDVEPADALSTAETTVIRADSLLTSW